MTSEPDSLVIQYMRRFDQKLDRVLDDVGDLKLRMTTLEERFAGVEMNVAGIQRRIDRVETRLDRIEKRLDLVDSPYGGVKED
jgi:predicted  nucleic acid-binding Zn-ribbon protein